MCVEYQDVCNLPSEELLGSGASAAATGSIQPVGSVKRQNHVEIVVSQAAGDDSLSVTQAVSAPPTPQQQQAPSVMMPAAKVISLQDEVDQLMDHSIEIDSNTKIRNEHVNPWTLRFLQEELERDVSHTIHYSSTHLHIFNIIDY